MRQIQSAYTFSFYMQDLSSLFLICFFFFYLDARLCVCVCCGTVILSDYFLSVYLITFFLISFCVCYSSCLIFCGCSVSEQFLLTFPRFVVTLIFAPQPHDGRSRSRHQFYKILHNPKMRVSHFVFSQTTIANYFSSGMNFDVRKAVPCFSSLNVGSTSLSTVTPTS